MKSNLSGATLLELLVFVLVSIIVLGEIPPAVRALYERRVVDAAADKLQKDLTWALNHSFLSQNEISISVSRDSYLISTSPPRGVTLRKNLSFDRSSTLYFYPSGVASPATITITSASLNFRCVLTLSLRGRVRKECK